MTSQVFFELAETAISQNPLDRLPKDIKNMIAALPADTEKMMFDVHAHCFTQDHVPQGLMGLGWIRHFSFGMDVVAFCYKVIVQWKKWLHGKDYDYYTTFGRKRFLEHFKSKYKTSDGVLLHQFHRYNMAFDEKLQRSRPHIFIIELMMDMERGISGAVTKPFYEQWKELSELRGKWQHNKSIIPFLAVDPRNPNVYEDFLAAFSDPGKRINHTGQPFLDHAFPFFGVKIYPCLGYQPSDPVLMNIFKVCAAKRIPVTTHCGGAVVRFSGNRIIGKHHVLNGGQWELADYTFDCSRYGKARQETEIANFFNAPFNWIPVMEAYPTLKLNLAHFGGSYQWRDYRNGVLGTHVAATMQMVERYPTVYADISYAYATKRNLVALVEMLYSAKFTAAQRDVFRTKFLHGSDYFMTDLEKSLITVVVNLFRQLSDDKPMLNQLCIHNPMRFLFG